MIDRRRFLQCLAVAAASPPLANAAGRAETRLGPLRADPNKLLDLPDGFSYRVVSKAGDTMDDGFRVPPAHDGMAAFAGSDGRVVLVCNHEMPPAFPEYSAFGTGFEALPEPVKERVYDHGGGTSPGAGGTTTTVYDPATGRTERQHLSLAGTELNCAGGVTPWDSWLSCEECFESPGTGFSRGRLITREEKHGYVFEVPALETGLAEPVPIKAMGRFEHEACAVHAASGIVYMTEDRHYSLFYRYIPDVPGRLREGGRLQALAIAGRPARQLHNWTGDRAIGIGESLATEWIDLDDVDPAENDLRLRGAAAGAATFARGEGLCTVGDAFAFTCTIGGRQRLGQVFLYQPSPVEGRHGEKRRPGRLVLLAEAGEDSLLRNADNLTMAPWGDLVVCEDTSGHCGLVGIRPDGTQYPLADNAWSKSELAGVCFAPDGRTLFVNIQYPGTTLAITGPWPG
ncbi:MAG TPA: alkaline phosphatase PhoX [Woeseiaceae bacterium]|nr:alkaline phosphatase PhoX [Woeseiaceae bacterium]